MSESIEHENPWRELWVEWFEFSGEPWKEPWGNRWGEMQCFFCGARDSHRADCVYLKAKRLLDEEAR